MGAYSPLPWAPDDIVDETYEKVLAPMIAEMAARGTPFVGLLYAGFSIRDFSNIPEGDPCLFRDAHIRQLYIAFIVFLIIYYTFNTFTSSTITSIITNVARFLVPPALLGLSSYLVFITNYFMHMAPKLVVQ
jgi:hypothetical protein